MQVRRCTHDDAWPAADLLRRSITELCAADHGGDPTRLEPWLANKTPEEFARWIEDAQNVIVTAVDGEGRPLGVAALRRPDAVMLNYVHPEAQRRGVGRAMMTALEAEARAAGVGRLHLTSTRTAHAFYAALGYVDVGEASSFGMPAFRMEKLLP